MRHTRTTADEQLTDERCPDPCAHPGVLMGWAADRFGAGRVARWCADLAAGRVGHDDPDEPSLVWVGGQHAERLLRRGADLGDQDYWPRVWGLRGLLHRWAPQATPDVVGALRDPAWRVREMASKVVRRYELGEAGDLVADLAADPVPRVRVAAVCALALVGEAEHAPALHEAESDPDPAVRHAAAWALETLRERLDRDL